jgi:hypothetical protein
MADRNDADLDHYGDVTFQSGSTLTVASGASVTIAAGVQLRATTTAVAASANATAGYSSVDTTAGSVTLTLPTLASTTDGTEYIFEKAAAGNSMIIDGNGAETIEGAANVTRTDIYSVVHIRKMGSVWQLLGDLKATNNLADVANNGTTCTNIGALQVGNNLSDLGAAATARTNLGVPATADVLAVASNLSDVASAATSRGNLGIAMVLHNPSISLAIADAAVWYYIHPTGAASAVLTSIDTRLSGTLTTGNATLTAAIDGTPVTNGVVTITEAGSAAGDEDVATPTAARTLAAGQVLSLTVGGTNDAARTASVSIRLTY